MSSLSECSDDELMAEVRARLDAGRIGYAGLCSRHQLDARAAWSALLDLVRELSLGSFDDPVLVRIRTRMHELADAPGLPPPVRALNTALPGVAAPLDHQSMMDVSR